MLAFACRKRDEGKPEPVERYGYIYHTMFMHPDGELRHYIGQRKAKRLDRNYVGSGYRLHNLFNKYGRKGKVRLVCWSTSESDLNAKELYYIALARKVWSDTCVNIRAGGNSSSLAESTKIKISRALTGRKMSPEAIAKSAAARTGFKHTDESIAKMSAAHSGKVLSKKHRKKIAEAGTGRTHSAETKAKMAESRRLWHAQRKAHLAESQKG